MSEHGHQEADPYMLPAPGQGGVSEHAHDLPFTDEEWNKLQASDLAAAKGVVTLLLGVFCMGIVIYSIVCIAIVS